MLDEPFVNGRSRPGLVDGAGQFGVGDLDAVQESSATGRGRARDDIVCLEPGAELVVVPGRVDVVLGDVEVLGGFGRSVRGLGRDGRVARRDGGGGIVVG